MSDEELMQLITDFENTLTDSQKSMFSEIKTEFIRQVATAYHCARQAQDYAQQAIRLAQTHAGKA